MQHDWILDVLADLRTFAKANSLEALAEQLEDTTLIAAAEIASRQGKTHVGAHGEKGRSGPDIRGLGRHHGA